MTDKDPTDKSKHKKVKKSKRKNDSTSNDTETKQVIISNGALPVECKFNYDWVHFQ